MKAPISLAVLLALCGTVNLARAQSVSVNIISPGSGAMAGDTLSIIVSASSTYQLQGIQASVGGQNVDLVYSDYAYRNCQACSPQPGWTNTLSLTGLPHGTNTLIVTGTDVFATTGQSQRNIIHDTPPVLSVAAPVNGTVARPSLAVAFSATDDDVVNGPQLALKQAVDYSGGPVFATANNTMTTNVSLDAYDGQAVSLGFFATDSAKQVKALFRQVYVQSSTNLVEVARVSEGRIIDLQPDRILFLLDDTDGTGPTLKIQSRSNGVESVVYHQPATVWRAQLAPHGAVASIETGNPSFIYQWRNGSQTQYASTYVGEIALAVKESYAVWSWGAYSGNPQVGRVDLQAGTSLIITNMNALSDTSFDVAGNGDVVFAGRDGYSRSPAIYKFHQGVISTLVNDFATTNYYPKTDGTNVFYIKSTPTNQALMLISGAGESIVATGPSIGPDYLLNNGWTAFEKSGGGQMQIWRRSPAGTLTQLTFFGTSSTLAELAPNGEVAFANGSRLYISKGSWPPADIAPGTPASGLTPIWQDNRWYASMGRSLFQIYTGAPQIASPQIAAGMFSLDLIAAQGQRVVTQISSNTVDWTDFSTNDVADGANLRVQCPVTPSPSSKFFRLRLQ
jgi:hypothetical protein